MKRKYSKIIKKIAKQKGIPEEIVYNEMQKAIEAGFNSPEPAVQEYWRSIVPDGKIPAPEKVIEILSSKIKSDIK
jgi:hypothetical protein